MAQVVSGRGDKRMRKDLSNSDPVQNVRPDPKRQCEGGHTSAGTNRSLIMIVRKEQVHEPFSRSEQATLEDHINRVFVQSDRSIRGLRWLQISKSPYALQYECSSEEAFDCGLTRL